MFCIKINNRYLEWYSDNWYGTTDEPLYIFSEDDLEEIMDRLIEHYVYRFTAISKDGHTIHKSYFSKKLIAVKQQEADILNKKKKAFKVSSKKILELLME